MAEQNMPNEASRKDKAEGERWIEQGGSDIGDRGMQPPRDEAVNREAGDLTPRRYEQPVEADDDPVMPGAETPQHMQP